MSRRNGHDLECNNCEALACGVFSTIQGDDLLSISECKVTNLYKRGQTLFFQGNPPYGLYCISHGTVKVSKIGNDGKESIVRMAKKGDLIGHRSLFTEDYYTATATALEDSVICFIDKKFICKAIETKPAIAMSIINKLSRDLGSAEKKVASLFQKNVRERLAELLLCLKESYGKQGEKGSWEIGIKLTREEMASMIGVANETLIRFMTEFKDEEIITQKGKTIYIINEDKLIDFADLYY
jgi:CRP-like cAMP-binding protein